MARKREAAHADERWLLTYADMITLLMALFMVLFSIAVVNKGKFDELAKSLKAAFSGPLDSGGTSVLSVGSQNPAESANSQFSSQSTAFATDRQLASSKLTHGALKLAATRATAQDKSLEKAKAEIDQRIAQLGLTSQVHTQLNERGLVIRLLTDKILFGLGSERVKREAVPLLATIAHAIDPIPNAIRIEGHTDRVPYNGDPYGNWRLSVLRAVSVLEVLGEHGLDPGHHQDLAPQGFGSTQPLVLGGPANQPLNRRVEIVVLRRNYVGEAERAASGPLGVDPTGSQQPFTDSPPQTASAGG